MCNKSKIRCGGLTCLITLVLAVGHVEVLQGVTVLENFNSDPRWNGSGNKTNSNDYGYQANPSNKAGGINPGEAGGTFKRTGSFTYYADTDLGGSFDTFSGLTMSGKIDVTAAIPDPGSDRNILGYFDINSETPTMIGIRICDPKNSLADWRIRLYSINSTGDAQGNPSGSGAEMTVNGDYSFEWSYDPNIGDRGSLTMRITTSTGSIWVGDSDTTASKDETITYDLPSGHGTAELAASFNAFGMGVFKQDINAFTSNVYFDDLGYIVFEMEEASKPNPGDGQEYVPQDVVLNWKPGKFAPSINGHKVYLSENFNDVNDATGGVAQDANSYAPLQRLDLGTTYYWRVDEVNAPPTSHIEFKGDIWSFTTEPVGYPIENVTATASSTGQEGMGPENTINGSGLDANDLHSMEAMGMWVSSDEPNGAWIEYDLHKVYKLHQMWVWNSNQVMEPLVGLGLKDVTIEYSTNGTDYTRLGTTHEFARAPGAVDYAHNTTIDFSGVTAKYVRLTANSNWGGLLEQFGLSEVRFLYIPVYPREPDPDSGTRNISIGTIDEPIDVTLGFRAGREAVTHDVYLSTDEQAVADGTAPVTTVTESSYGPLSLDLGTTYYWKINEVNEAETPTTWQGDIWNFTTQKYFVVDDFEDYNDYPPNEIWATWVDGYGVPANGATSGYPAPDFLAGEHFVETATVHGGSQAMPFFYSNTGIAAYSEGKRTFAVPRDWTTAGIQTLVLYFHGSPGNTGQLYVEVNGSKVLYDGDAVDMVRPRWKQWNIDLASLGMDMQSVTTLAIGIDGSGATGTLYFEDIRLYRLAPEPAEEIWLEAEAADSTTPPMNVYDDPLASGGRYIGTDEGIGNLFQDNPPADGIATYSFAAQEGTYKILFRVIAAPDTGSNSFWVRIPGATSPQITRSDGWVNTNPMDEGDSWHWDEIHNEDQDENIVHFTLPTGQHTLEIARREDGTLLDAIVITDDVD